MRPTPALWLDLDKEEKKLSYVQHTFEPFLPAAALIPRTTTANIYCTANQTLPTQKLSRVIMSWQRAQPVKIKASSCYEEMTEQSWESNAYLNVVCVTLQCRSHTLIKTYHGVF